jgi:TRAP-type C4-dicarboxylate transport system permease small subunit
VLYRRFPAPVVKGLTVVNCLMCGGFFALMAWQVVEKGNILMRTGEVTETLRIAYYPFTYGVAVGCGFLTLAFLKQLVEAFQPEREAGK